MSHSLAPSVRLQRNAGNCITLLRTQGDVPYVLLPKPGAIGPLRPFWLCNRGGQCFADADADRSFFEFRKNWKGVFKVSLMLIVLCSFIARVQKYLGIVINACWDKCWENLNRKEVKEIGAGTETGVSTLCVRLQNRKGGVMPSWWAPAEGWRGSGNNS